MTGNPCIIVLPLLRLVLTVGVIESICTTGINPKDLCSLLSCLAPVTVTVVDRCHWLVIIVSLADWQFLRDVEIVAVVTLYSGLCCWASVPAQLFVESRLFFSGCTTASAQSSASFTSPPTHPPTHRHRGNLPVSFSGLSV